MKIYATNAGAPVHEATLTSDAGAVVNILSQGAIVRDWRVPDRDGKARSVTLGFDDFGPYVENRRSFGMIAGRVANRIRNARFTLDGKTYQLDPNEGPNQLHGGRRGIGRLPWTMEEADSRSVRLTLTSEDGAMGYPGHVVFTALFTLDGHTLTFELTGVPDRPTPIALAQHSYYRLGAPAEDHLVQVNASHVTEVDEALIPTGRIIPVEGTPLDFRTPRRLGRTPVDSNFCLDERDPAVTLETEHYRLSLATDRPGVQVYTSFNMPQFDAPGHDGVVYGPFCGIALEAQDYPDAVNHPDFGNVIATPDRPYRQKTSVTIMPR